MYVTSFRSGLVVSIFGYLTVNGELSSDMCSDLLLCALSRSSNQKPVTKRHIVCVAQTTASTGAKVPGVMSSAETTAALPGREASRCSMCVASFRGGACLQMFVGVSRAQHTPG